MIPGELLIDEGLIELNSDLKKISIEVINTGDRPIQVGSHYHFYEVNPALKFDKEKSKGCHLDIAPGTAIRFEPGLKRTVTLVEFKGKRAIYGFRQEIMGELQEYIE